MPSAFARIGTRGSPLALAQARAVRDRDGVPPIMSRRTPSRSGDPHLRRCDSGPRRSPRSAAKACSPRRSRRRCCATSRPRSPFGEGHADAVTARACRSRLACRARIARDIFVSRMARTLAELPPGARVGTGIAAPCSAGAATAPDLMIVPLRGNVETRLRKLGEGEVDATILALAGLKRLGLADARPRSSTSTTFPPAVGQGAIAIEARADDDATPRDCSRRSIDADDRDRACRPSARSSLCSTVPAARRLPATRNLPEETRGFRGLILKPDGSAAFAASPPGRCVDAARSARMRAASFGPSAGADFFAVT